MKALIETLINRIISVSSQIKFYPFLHKKAQGKKGGREDGNGEENRQDEDI